MDNVYFYFYFGGKVYKYKTFRQCEYQLLRKLRAFYKRNGYYEGAHIMKRFYKDVILCCTYYCNHLGLQKISFSNF